TSTRYNISPGSAIMASAPENAPNASAEVFTPRGRRIPLSVTSAEANSAYRFTQTQLPGLYHVRFTSNGKSVSDVPYHVVRNATESDLQPLGRSARERILEPAGLQFSGALATLPQSNQIAPRREPLWGALLAALVALLASELLIANRIARHRVGFSVSGTTR
ncbi:MAG TPA: hypothetical protein VFW73_10385, partial [Lacipirellulaceae bacterium]|nr:hypothetical protein [Lacipirellulaceae bacterium]